MVYDGNEKQITARVANTVGNDTVNLTLKDDKATVAGSYTAEVTAVSNPNYTLTGGKNLTQEWTIAEASNTNTFTQTPAIKDGVYGSTPSTTTTTTTTTDNANSDKNASPQSGDTPWPWAVVALALISAVVGAGALSARTIRSYRAACAGKHSAPRRRM